MYALHWEGGPVFESVVVRAGSIDSYVVSKIHDPMHLPLSSPTTLLRLPRLNTYRNDRSAASEEKTESVTTGASLDAAHEPLSLAECDRADSACRMPLQTVRKPSLVPGTFESRASRAPASDFHAAPHRPDLQQIGDQKRGGKMVPPNAAKESRRNPALTATPTPNLILIRAGLTTTEPCTEEALDKRIQKHKSIVEQPAIVAIIPAPGPSSGKKFIEVGSHRKSVLRNHAPTPMTTLYSLKKARDATPVPQYNDQGEPEWFDENAPPAHLGQ
ncbi:hypothetical protein FRC06_008150 [Ceratobasidium sp. 370]|nr:hypothetical protein FRC06_008150 [Ceratobasidium sp. 370]